MNITIVNIIAVAIIVLASLGILGFRLYKLKKINNNITLQEFMEMYQEQIVSLLKDVIILLQVNIDDFESKEEYDRVIVETTVSMLRESAEDLGIDKALLELFSDESLESIIRIAFNLFAKESFFAVLSDYQILSRAELYGEEFVEEVKNKTNI